jgi:pantoate--beta-alanine ligase
MSSRNRYLSSADRARAAALPRLMDVARDRIGQGELVGPALATLREQLLAAGFDRVDYAELADAANLQPLGALGEAPARLFVAARIAGTRLIDNMPVERR